MESEIEIDSELESEPERKVYFTRSSLKGERSPSPLPKKRKKRSTPSGPTWKYKEKKALYNALLKHGFNDTSILAKEVKTRTQTEVEYFIERWTIRISKKQKYPELNINKLFTPNMSREYMNYSVYPPIALWKKAAHLAIYFKYRSVEHAQVFAELFKKFQEEEPECDRPDMPNFKKMYKFLHDILNESSPAVLAPLESFTALLLLEDTSKFIKKHDFEEEKKFAREYLGPIKFAPSIKREKKECKTENCKSQTVCKTEAPEESANETAASGFKKDEVIACSSKENEMIISSSNGIEATPSTSNSVEATPSTSNSVEATPSTSNSVEATPSISNSVEATPSTSNSVEATPSTSNSVEATPSISNSVEATPSISNSVEATPSISNSVEATPSSSNSVETKSCSSNNVEAIASTSRGDEATAANSMERETVYNSEESWDENDDDAVNLPLPVYEDYVRHVKIKQTLNPLLAHVYLLHEEQSLIKKHIQSLPL